MNTILLVALPIEFQVKNFACPVIYTGVGLINATITTYDVIVKYKPEKIINYGTAGSLGSYKGLLTVSQVCQRDADCEPLSARGLMLGDDKLYISNNSEGVRCGSGNNFVRDPDEWTLKNCDIVDMELFAIAKVCEKLNVNWYSKKYISDFANEDSGKVWQDNLVDGQKAFVQWFNYQNEIKFL